MPGAAAKGGGALPVEEESEPPAEAEEGAQGTENGGLAGGGEDAGQTAVPDATREPGAAKADNGMGADDGLAEGEGEPYDEAGVAAYEADDAPHDEADDAADDEQYDGSYEEPHDGAPDQAYDRPNRRASGTSRVRRRRRRRLAAAVSVVVGALLVIGIVAFIRVSHDIHPTGHPGRTVTVSIPTGASTGKIGDELAKAGVIHGPLVFEVYVKLEGAGPLMPGTYRLAQNEPYSSVVYALEQGPPPVVDKLVVPEGFTIRQIAAAVGRLPGIGMSAEAFTEAATGGQVRSPYEPAGTNDLEGFLFPATYPVQKGETADDLVQYMVDTFDHYASELDLSAKAAHLHYTPYQILKVASIVEREAKFESDRGLIASTIYNRLSIGMPIGAESTLLYGLGDPKGPVNIETRNPYNTLINKGLPPTPISNPGIPSLEAALSPPKTDYLFWVEINPDGKMGYASDNAGFVQLQAECRKVHLC